MSTIMCCRDKSSRGEPGCRTPAEWVRRFGLAVGLGLTTACGSGGAPAGPGGGGCEEFSTRLAKTLGDEQTKAPGAQLDPLNVQLTCTQTSEPPVQRAIEDAIINWTVTAGDGTVGGGTTAQSATNAAGTAGVIWTLGPAPGTNTLEASYMNDDGEEVTATFTAHAVTPGLCDGGTVHSTDLPSSTTWTAAASPHRLPGGISLRGDGNVLTIEPGAVVCGESQGSGLFLETGARIVAEGTAASPIRFLTKDGVSFWAGVVMNGAPAAASSLKHVVVERTSIRGGPTHMFVLEDATISQSFYTAVDLGAPGTRATRVVIDHPAVDGAQVGGDGAVFEGRVTGAARYGVILNTQPATAATLQNCEVTGGSDHGIFAGAFGELTITGCNIFGNAGDGVHEFSSDLVVHAQGNWWGDPAGPAGPAGDGVSGDVDASNPLAAPLTLGY